MREREREREGERKKEATMNKKQPHLRYIRVPVYVADVVVG